MLYSLTVLLIGIYLGQELNLPSIKQLSLSLIKTQQQNSENQDYIQVNYIESFFSYIFNKQKE